MKKSLICTILLLCFLIPSLAFSQTLGSSTEVSEALDLSKVDYRYNALLEFFLQKTLGKDYQAAYGMTAGSFQQRYSLDIFTTVVNESGLTLFTSKKWTSFKDEMKSIGVTTVKGDFTTPDGVVHHITFFVIIGGETEIKIGHISEEVAVADLAKRFPETELFKKITLKDLKKITNFVRGGRTISTYKYLSTAAQNRTKLREIRAAFRMFKKKKLDLRLPKHGLITLSIDSPKLSDQGMMLFQGVYQNKTHEVNFTLAYDYEDWEWKLGIFSFDAKALNSPPT